MLLHFLSFHDVKIYYDNGPVEVSKMLSSVFNALLPNPIFRKVMPTEYKLFQAADLLCTLELVKLKLENNMFSKSKKSFFGNIRDLKKNHLKPLSKKEWSWRDHSFFIGSLILKCENSWADCRLLYNVQHIGLHPSCYGKAKQFRGFPRDGHDTIAESFFLLSFFA